MSEDRRIAARSPAPLLLRVPFLLSLLLILLPSLLLLPHGAAAQLSLDRQQYAVGEPVTLTVNATNLSDPELRIEGPTDSYRYLGPLDKPLTFYPSTPGGYVVTLGETDGLIRDESDFTVLPSVPDNATGAPADQAAGQAGAPFLAASKAAYGAGERVLIFGGVTGLDSPVLILATPAGALRYGGTLEFPITYQPDVPGQYRLILQSGGKDVLETGFTVSDGKELPANATNATSAAEGSAQPVGSPLDASNTLDASDASSVSDASSSGPQSPALGDLVLADQGDDLPLLRPRHALEAKNSEGLFLDATLTAFNSSGRTVDAQQNVTYPEIDLVPAHGPVERIRLDHARLGAADTIGLDEVPSAKVDLSGRYVPKAFAIDTGGVNFTNGTATSVAVGTELYKCKEWNFSAQQCDGSWALAMRLTPGEPYDIPLFPGDPGYAETGVASINTRKPLYHPGETAAIVIVVLDREGHLVEGADVNLTVTDPSNASTLLTTGDGDVIETQKGIYETNYSSTSLQGNYSLQVSAAGAGVNDTMDSYFTVLGSYAYDILRDAPVTTDPWSGPFNASITVDALLGQSGPFNLTELLPDAFTVSDYGGASETVTNGSRFLTWNNLTNGSTVSYSARPPYASPDLYTLGPATVDDTGQLFTEARPWYLAVDPTNALTRFNVSTGDSGYVRDANCGVNGAATQLMDGSTIQVGRYLTGSGREYRMFVDFDTSAIPDAATINSATLYVYLNSETGAPSDTISVYDCGYGPTLTTADYNTALGYDHGAIFTGSSSTGQYHSLALGTGAGNISLTGRTQFCLRINNGCSDANNLFDTLSTNSGNQPYLIINYTYNSAPTQSNPILNSTTGSNETTEDLTCYNQSTVDNDNDPVTNLYSWTRNGQPLMALYLPFEGGSNATYTKDYSGNGNDAAVSGATWNATGGFDGKGAYRFNSTASNSISITDSSSISLGNAITIAAWVKDNGTTDYRVIAAKNSEYLFRIDSDAEGGKLSCFINLNGAWEPRVTATAALSKNVWHYVACVWSNATGNLQVYVDGNLNATTSGRTGAVASTANALTLGSWNAGSYWDGMIDEVRIYNYTLSGQQILALYQNKTNVIKSNETSVGDNWTCTVTPNDGVVDGTPATSATLTVKAYSGSPPDITAASDSPDPISLGSPLNITATVTDPDNNVQKVWVNINGANYTMSNTSPTSWNVTIDTTGFSPGTLAYTVYANDTTAKTASFTGNTVTVTNTLTVKVTTNQSAYYLGQTVNATTNVSITGLPVNGAAVTTDIIRVETTGEPITDPWWNTSFHYRVRFTLNDTSGENRTDYWVSVPVQLDPSCSLTAHNNSLRLVDDNGQQLSFLEWNVTTCPSDTAYTQSAWITFRLNLSAGQGRNFYVYSDNSTGFTRTATLQGPMRIIYVDADTGNGASPDATDIGTRMGEALTGLGLSTTGFYDTLSTAHSSSDVPYSSVSPYAYVYYDAGARYSQGIYQAEANNLFAFVQQSGSLLLAGQDLGYDANRDGWIFNNVWDNLTHMGAGWVDNAGATSTDVVTAHPISRYIGPVGTTFSVSGAYPDGYTTIVGPVAVQVYNWSTAADQRAGTANDGLFDGSCPGCGKTVYYGGIIQDTTGAGISSATVRTQFLEGVVDWFLNNRSATLSQGSSQQWMARSSGATTASGLLALAFNSSAWTNTTYAAASLASKAGYSSGFGYTFFTMTVDYSHYPNITSVSDTPDPVPLGFILNISATVTDPDNNVQKVWVNINGTNYTLSNTSPTAWNVSVNTTGFALTTLTYTVYANDTTSYQATPKQGTVLVSNAFQASISTDKPQYTIGETVVATTQTYLGFQPTSVPVFTDIIRGVTDTPWWNTSWTQRLPFNLSSPDGTDRTDEIVRVNITGLAGGITNCVNQLRIVQGAAGDSPIVVPFTVESTDNSDWCSVRFLANVTAGTPTRYHAYYNNTGASNPGYAAVATTYVSDANMESGSSWTYAETETPDSGAYTTSQSNSPTHSYDISSGTSGTLGNYAEIYQDVSLPCVGCSLTVSAYNRMESAGTVADVFFAQIIMASTTISSVGTPGSGSSPTPWTLRSGLYTSEGLVERLHLRLLTNLTFTGYGIRNVYWDDVDIALSNPSTATFGAAQQWLSRTLNTTDVAGTANATFDTTGQLDGNYTAVSLVSDGPYSDGSGYFRFVILADAPPVVTLTSPSDGNVTNQTLVTFQCAATDDHGLVNLTFYNDFAGSWQANGSKTLSGTSGSGSFNGTLTADGTYLWSCLAYDNTGKGSFASANRTILRDTTPPSITLSAPPDGATITTAAVLFRYAVNDANNVSSCRLLIDGTLNQTNTTVTKNIPMYFGQSFADGAYSWAVSCTDQAGNANTSTTRTFTVAKANATLNGQWYERSDFSSCVSGVTCGIDLSSSRNATGHSVLFDPVQPSTNVTVVEAASQFMGTNGAYIPAGALVNFSGEFFTNPVSEGLVTWQLYRRNVSLAQNLICQDADNPLFSLTAGSCTPTSSVYLSPTEQLYLVLTFRNDRANNISLTHYWDASRGSYLNLSLTTVGFLSGNVTNPPGSPYGVSQNATFQLNCTYTCAAGTCFNVQAYAQYDPGSGFVPIGSSGGLALNGSQANPVGLGDITAGSNATASFTIFGNQTGSWPARCSATDVAETAYTGNVTIAVGDNTPPVVNLVSPGNDTFTNQDPVIFTYFANDSSGLSNCTLILNGSMNKSEDVISNGQNNTIVVSLPSGTYNWTVMCYDNTGLPTNATPSRVLKVDTVTPGLTVNYPINQTVDTSIVPFNWTVTDNWPANVTCNLTTDDVFNTTLSVAPGSPYVYPLSGFSLGVHNWSVACWDGADNTNASITYWFDVTDSAPVVTLVSPPDNNISNATAWTLVYQVSENNGLQWCHLYLDGQLNQTNTTPVDITGLDSNFTVTGLADGQHNWTVACNDTGGQVDEPMPWNFTSDTTPPSITPLTPADLANYTSTPNVTIGFNATDNLATNLTCSLSVNAGAINRSYNTTSGVGNQTTLYNQSDGSYAWNVTCTDAAGNSNTGATRTYYVDNPPKTSLLSPGNGNFTNTNVTFQYFADDNDGLANCSIYIDGTLNATQTEVTLGATNTFQVDNLAQGNHSWYVLCVDTGTYHDRNQTPSWNFTVDTTPPAVTLHAPPNSTINASWVLFNWTPTDNLAPSLSCNLTINGAVNKTYGAIQNGASQAVNVSGFPNGNHTWNVTCSDAAGNLGTSETRWFFINIPPSVYLQSPPNMTFSTGGSWNLTYIPVINNNNSDTAHFVNCSLYLNGQHNQTNTTITTGHNNSFLLSGVADGAYAWNVLCYEDSGAYGWSGLWTFVRDSQAPQPTITTPDGAWFKTPTPAIAFNITDNLNYTLAYQFFVDGSIDGPANGTIPANTSSSKALSSLAQGSHQVQLRAADQAGNAANSTNITINIDTASPVVTLLSPSSGNVTANSTVTLRWNVTDNLAADLDCNLTIDGSVNTTYVGLANGSTVNETFYNVSFGTHTWDVSCADYAGNVGTDTTRNFTVPQPDLAIDGGNITFSDATPVEGQNITVNATVFNLGLSAAQDVTVQFWLGDPDNGGTQIGPNQTIASIGPGENATLSQNYTAVIGQNDLYVVVDPPTATNGSISELNESNNKAFNGFQVGLYDIFSGLTVNALRVANGAQVPVWTWNVSNATGSNILVADSDSALSFLALQALGRDTSNASHFSDFATLDTKLGSSGLTDSVNRTWTAGGAPIGTAPMTLFGRQIADVPVIDSTNTSAFRTGILWDMSDGGASYNGGQDVAFITQINMSQQGSRGVYDYEIRVPATLRSYTGASPTVAFYVELK